VFFYAGHGLQVSSRNYLIPVDASLQGERDLATVIRLAGESGTDAGVVKAWVANSRHRRDWAARTLRKALLDKRARLDLEAIIHPEVYRRIDEWFANLPAGTQVAIADIPLLFETGHEHDFEVVIVCACSPAEQIRRLKARDGLTNEAARARLDAQWPVEEKVTRANIVIRTDGGFAETDRAVGWAYESLKSER